MDLIQIHPVGLIWGGLLILWFGFCSAYINKSECQSAVKWLGILLLTTGIFLLGIIIGGR